MSRSFTKLDPSWWIDEGDYFLAHSEFWCEAVNVNNSRCNLALDLGCGLGRFTIPLARISETVVSADVNRKMLESLKARAEEFNVLEKICIVVSDAQYLPFRDGCFNMVNFIGTMVHIPNQKKAIEEVHRVTEAGGKMIVDQTNYLSLRFLWEGLKIVATRAIRTRRAPEQKIFTKRCNLWRFKNMFREVGLSIVKVEGFQIIPFLPLLGLYHDARFHIIPLKMANRLDRLFRKTRLVCFAYNILMIGAKKYGPI